MRTLATKLVSAPSFCGSLARLLVIASCAAAGPAHAQDFFGFFRVFAPPPAPVPVYQPYDYGSVPSFERPRPKVRPRPKPVEIKMPEKPKDPGAIENPVPQLLADSTLRPGDMVMFPDGLRVFTGEPGDRHTLADFAPMSRAKEAVPASTRKLAAHLRPGVNAAWSAEGLKSGGKLAGARDVATTGSLRRAAR